MTACLASSGVPHGPGPVDPRRAHQGGHEQQSFGCGSQMEHAQASVERSEWRRHSKGNYNSSSLTTALPWRTITPARF
eukprot:scaffold48665_cov18-Prasinocladus_malaysianus.AAC.2